MSLGFSRGSPFEEKRFFGTTVVNRKAKVNFFTKRNNEEILPATDGRRHLLRAQRAKGKRFLRAKRAKKGVKYLFDLWKKEQKIVLCESKNVLK